MSETIEVLDEDDINSAIQSALEDIDVQIKDVLSDLLDPEVATGEDVRRLAREEAEGVVATLCETDFFAQAIASAVDERLRGRALKERDAIVGALDVARGKGKAEGILARVVAMLESALESI